MPNSSASKTQARFAAAFIGGSLLHVLSPQPVAAQEFGVRVVGIDHPVGEILAALCSPDEYPKGRCAFLASVPVRGMEAWIRFNGVAPGTYALKIFQDLNGDRVLNRGLFGIPKEPIGFGNDAEPKGGPPDFDAAAVRVDDAHADTLVTLRTQ